MTENANSTSDTEQVGGVDSLKIIDEHPLPTDPEEAAEFHENPTFSYHDEPPTPDALREYQQVIAENREWRVFALHIYGYGGHTWVWNHQLGYGIRFSEDEEFHSLVDALDGLKEALVA